MSYGGLAYTGPGCHFCGEPAAPGIVRLSCDDPTSAVLPPGQYVLCTRHRELLRAAGSRGRVHKATGLRWWLVR